jgi:RES domain
MSSAEQSFPTLPDKLPIRWIHPDQPFYRLNRKHGQNEEIVTVFDRSLHFGRGGNCRFNDPNNDYGVVYAGEDAGVCVMETLCREGIQVLAKTDAHNYNLFLIIARKSLRLADLSQLNGSPTTEDTDRDYFRCQQWSRAIWEHPDTIDGIYYKSWQDSTSYCYAIFDRATKIQAISLGNLPEDNTDLLKSIVRRYDIKLQFELPEQQTYQNVLLSVETKI